jgi:hypothetical protein
MERLLFRVAKRWVAGYNTDEAIDAALDTNSHGMSAILNFLGEDTTDAKLVDMTVNEYLLLMDLMHARKGVCLSNLRSLALQLTIICVCRISADLLQELESLDSSYG